MRLNRAEIASLIPHTGAMCLLDGVTQWDSTRIRCVSRSHLDPANPMRAAGCLPALCGIEYAAQAMAVHGGLAGLVRGKPRMGWLASLREVTCLRQRLDDLDGELVVEAAREAGDGARAIYSFHVRVGETEVLSGRAAVVLDAAWVGA